MKDKKEIKDLLAGCYRHAPLIHDDFQRHGIENFIAGLEYCLGTNCVINTQIESAANDLGLRVKLVRIDEINERISL